jgi:putative peptidoglycan lipid II flippase
VTLATPLVAAVFEHGKFTAVDSQETASAFMAQGVGIFLVAGVRQLVIVFFALGKTAIPVYVAIVDLFVFALLGWGLRQEWGHVGVSLAVTGARITQFSLLWFALRRHLPSMHGSEVARSFSKSMLSAAIAGVLCFLAYRLLPGALEASTWLRLLPAAVGTAVFLVTFLGMAWLLKSEELSTIGGPILRRIRRLRA